MHRRPLPQIVKEFEAILAELNRFVRPDELAEVTACRLNLLGLLDRDRPTRPSELARARGVTRSAISHALRRLESAGIVSRRRDPRDRRFVEVRLTEEGERLKRWPALVEPERVEKLLWLLPAGWRVATRRWLWKLVLASRGRDFWREHRTRGLGARASPG